MEIVDSTIGIFYLSKVLTLAPFSIKRNSKGSLEVRRSIFFSFYTIILSLTMVFLTYRGLLFDANSKIPVRASFRMKSATSKIVTALDVSVVVFSCLAGSFCGIFGFKSVKEFNSRLVKIDESLHSYTNFKRDRIRSLILIFFPMITISILLGLDVNTWMRFAEAMKTSVDNTELNIQWYLPFYSLYFILTGLHITFANTAYGLSRRYSRLNYMLRSNFLFEKKKDVPQKPKVVTVKTILSTQTNMNSSLAKIATETVQNEAQSKSILLRLMAENHESLGKCVAIVSSSYGVAVLFILISCLLHLVATAYFLFLEILVKKDSGYIYLQVLWILFHFFRLLMVVEPCHLATKESYTTIQIVCEIERKVHDPILVEEIKKFWQQLLSLNSEFTAIGLCKVNRNILTSFSSAIATYLVILMQIQSANG